MTPVFFKVIAQGEPRKEEGADGTTLCECPIRLLMVSTSSEQTATLLGDDALIRFKPGDAIYASLHYFKGQPLSCATVNIITRISLTPSSL